MIDLFKKKYLSPDYSKDSDNTKKSLNGFLQHLKNKLTKTRDQFTAKIYQVLQDKTQIDNTMLEKLEDIFLQADVGLELTERILGQLKKKNFKGEPIKQIQDLLSQQLQSVEAPLIIESYSARPFVILMIGVNGTGKTTTIAKITHWLQQKDFKVMLAAGDTFRAAAVEQLQNWGQRLNVSVIAQQHQGSDSASVIYDAYQAAKSQACDVLIADTAGRLHTKTHLMKELEKIRRVLQKTCPNAPHETLLVLDALTGQNSIKQAEMFHQAMHITGICLSKLDGTAKGGAIFSIADKLNIPIRWIGLGEQLDDLKTFEAKSFIQALFQNEDKKIK